MSYVRRGLFTLGISMVISGMFGSILADHPFWSVGWLAVAILGSGIIAWTVES